MILLFNIIYITYLLTILHFIILKFTVLLTCVKFSPRARCFSRTSAWPAATSTIRRQRLRRPRAVAVPRSTWPS